MKAEMMLGVVKAAWGLFLRDAAKKVVKDTKNDVDDHAVDVLDMVLGEGDKN